MKNKKRTTLQNAVDWIVKSAEDLCAICAKYDEQSQTGEFNKDESIEPCLYCRADGRTACRNGVIEYFSAQQR